MDKLTGHHGTRLAAPLFALAFLLAVVIVLPAWADEPPRDGKKKPTKLAKNLIGTWTLEEAKAPGNPSGVGSRLKFFTGTHWMITQPDPKTGKVVFHHGGRYTLDGETMATTTDFANESTGDFIGQERKFKITVDGNTLKQTGVGNPYTETWKRVK